MTSRLEGMERLYSPDRKLTDGEVTALIAAVGVHEAQAIAFSLIEGGKGISQTNLQERFILAQGTAPIWKPDKYTLGNYVNHSFGPAGLVEKYIDPNIKQLMFARTAYGEEQGLSLAGLMLELSEKYPKFSLEQVWGQAQSPSKSSPQAVRLKIFEAITQLPSPIRQLRLATFLGEKDTTVGNHLRELTAHGIIVYHPLKPDVPFRWYRLMENPPSVQPQPYEDQPILTQEVFALFRTYPHRKWTREDLMYAVIQANPHRAENQKSLKNKVGLIATSLARQGFIEIDDQQPEVLLTRQQRAFLNNLLEIVHGFQEQDPALLAEGIRTTQEIIHDPGRVLKLVSKAKDASTQIDQVPLDITKEQLLIILRTHGKLSVRALQDWLLYLFRRRLVTQRLSTILNELKREGTVEIVEKRKAAYWDITNRQDARNSRLSYQWGREYFERKIRIAKLWRAGKYEEALAATNIKDASQIFQLLQQQNPQLSYTEIGKRVGGRKRSSIELVVVRFNELGIPLARDVSRSRRLRQSA